MTDPTPTSNLQEDMENLITEIETSYIHLFGRGMQQCIRDVASRVRKQHGAAGHA